MTSTLRRAPRRDPNVRRKGAVYAFTTLRVHESGPQVGLVLNGTTEDGYVGKTRQTLAQREQQHRGGSADGEPVQGEDIEEQPWWEITVGGIRLLEQGSWTDDELAEREQYWIDRLEPRYNFMLNRNPRRIPKPVAREHRDNRDRAKGLEARQWPAFSTQRSVRVDPVKPPRQPAPSRPSAAVRRRRNVVLGYTAGWALQAGLWWPLLAILAHHWQVAATGRVWPVLAAGLAGAPLMFGIRRKRHRKAAWLVLAVVTVILAGVVAR
jgi:hypothetical protein